MSTLLLGLEGLAVQQVELDDDGARVLHVVTDGCRVGDERAVVGVGEPALEPAQGLEWVFALCVGVTRPWGPRKVARPPRQAHAWSVMFAFWL